MEDTRKNITIYTDGACSGNPGPGGYGAVLMYKNNQKQISGGVKSTTNNRMELYAVVKALETLKYPCDVTLYSDSAYVVDSIEKGWIDAWKLKNWVKSDDQKVKNIDLWQKILDYMNIHNISFKKVKGHSDNEYNNMCDKLARGEIKKLKDNTN